jgi:hypothetical protein
MGPQATAIEKWHGESKLDHLANGVLQTERPFVNLAAYTAFNTTGAFAQLGMSQALHYLSSEGQSLAAPLLMGPVNLINGTREHFFRMLEDYLAYGVEHGEESPFLKDINDYAQDPAAWLRRETGYHPSTAGKVKSVLSHPATWSVVSSGFWYQGCAVAEKLTDWTWSVQSYLTAPCSWAVGKLAGVAKEITGEEALQPVKSYAERFQGIREGVRYVPAKTVPVAASYGSYLRAMMGQGSRLSQLGERYAAMGFDISAKPAMDAASKVMSLDPVNRYLDKNVTVSNCAWWSFTALKLFAAYQLSPEAFSWGALAGGSTLAALAAANYFSDKPKSMGDRSVYFNEKIDSRPVSICIPGAGYVQNMLLGVALPTVMGAQTGLGTPGLIKDRASYGKDTTRKAGWITAKSLRLIASVGLAVAAPMLSVAGESTGGYQGTILSGLGRSLGLVATGTAWAEGMGLVSSVAHELLAA